MPWTQYINLKGPQGEPGSDANVTSASIAGALGYTPESSSNKGQPNGYAGLDGNGRVPISQLPNSIMEYQGTYNASTNSPALTNGTGNTGDVYRVSVAGTRNFGAGNISFEVGDYVIYSGSEWQKSDTTDAVSTVAGLTGDVSGSSLRTAMSAITRSVQTITAPTTLGNAPSTDYVYFLSNFAGSAEVSTGDQNRASNLTLLNFDGSDGSSTFTCTAPTPKTWSVAHGTPVLSTAEKKYGTASLSLNGSSSISSTSSVYNRGTGDFTVEFWMRPNNTGDQVTVTTRGSNATYYGEFGIYITGGVIAWYDWHELFSSGVIATANVWTHVAVSKSGTTLRIFVNGVLSGTKTHARDINTTTLRLGAHTDGGYFFNGFIDDFRFSDICRYTATFTPPTKAFDGSAYTLISPEQPATVGTPTLPTAVGNTNSYTIKNQLTSNIPILTSNSQLVNGVTVSSGGDDDFVDVVSLLHFEGSSVTESATAGPTWLPIGSVGGISTAVKRFGASSLTGGGQGSYYYASTKNDSFSWGTGDFTIEFWAYATGGTSFFFDTTDAGATLKQSIFIENTNVLYYYANGVQAINAGQPPFNSWFHIAVCRAAGNTRMFLNGIQVGSTYSDPTNYVCPANRPMLGNLGQSPGNVYHLKGYMDEFRATRGARYTANFTPQTTAFPDNGSFVVRPKETLRLISDGSGWQTL